MTTLKVALTTALTASLLTAPASAKKPPSVGRAAITIKMPQSDAKLKIDNTRTKLTGTTREFETPPLEPGKEYTYRLEAFWEPNNYTKITRVKTVSFRAGESKTVDMTTKNPDEEDKILVRYVPTPDDVVKKMLEVAGVKKGDVVYDLGCGNGKIVITAVADFGAKRGVGVDIDPVRIKEANELAKKRGVADKVEFRKADVLNLKDIPDANVVCLYMGRALNEALQPILRKNLKPGSRVVSHRFLMRENWPPKKTIKMTDIPDGFGGTDDFLIHLWVIGEKKKK